MTIKTFLGIEIEDAPTELKLSVELRCREIMASDNVNDIKKYCTHLVRHQMKQDVFLSSLLGRLIELQAIVDSNDKAFKRRLFFMRMKRFFRIP